MNMKDIAEKAGVSISTVSKVLNNKAGDISESTRKKVLDVIKEHNYQPYGVKNGFRNKTNIIALIIPSISKNYYARILESAEKEASAAGYSIAVYCSGFSVKTEQKLIKTVESKDFDGLILVAAAENSSNRLKKCSKPVVIIGKGYDNFPSFYFDYSKIGEQAVAKLIDYNHKNIGCIVELHQEEFLRGAKLAMSQAGLPAGNLFHTRIAGDTDIEKAIKRFTSLGVTAFFSSSIKITSHIYKFATKRYWEIPKDFSLISFEDETASDIFFPPVSTVRISLEETAALSARSLINLIENGMAVPHMNEGGISVIKTASMSLPVAGKEKNIVVIINSKKN